MRDYKTRLDDLEQQKLMSDFYLAEIKKIQKLQLEEMIKIKEIHELEIVDLRNAYQKEIANLMDKSETKMTSLHESYLYRLNEAHEKKQSLLKDIEEKYQTEILYLEKSIKELENIKIKYQKENQNLLNKNVNLTRDFNQMKIELNLYKDSATYKAGEKIVNLLSNPLRVFTFPFDMFKIFKEGKARYPNKFQKHGKEPSKKIEKEIIKKKPSNSKLKTLKKLKANLTLYHKNNLQFHKINSTLVSIIILNRNGKKHLETLFSSLFLNTVHKNYELIIVDNDSTDDSIEFIKLNQKKFNLTLIENSNNLSFSKANNLAVKKAKGDYLVFLNNDTEVTYGWLRELLGFYVHNENSGVVGPKLVYPFNVNNLNFEKELKVQAAGILFNEEKDFIRPINHHNGCDPYNDEVNKVRKFPALTAACALISKKRFNEVSGFDETYFYGYEDVDLGLKLIQKGYDNFYCPTALIYHYEFGSQEKNTNDELRNRRILNMNHFKDKWFKYLTEKILKDKINKQTFWTDNKQLTFAFAVSNAGDNVKEGDYFTALELATALIKKGYKCKFLSAKTHNWYQVGLDVDILISMLDVYNLKKIENAKDSMIKIAWARNWFDRWCDQISYNYYDIVLASGVSACQFMKQKGIHDVHLFPIATNPLRFNMDQVTSHFDRTDYLFTGSYWNSPREIIDFLNPSKIPYKFRIYGHNWEQIEKLKNYSAGFVCYEDVPALYKNTKIILDDANFATKPFGSVNSRVFDALASGRLVLTNGRLGAEEIFNGELPFYTNERELEELLIHYLSDEDDYQEKVKILQDMVLKNHTYVKRATDLIDIITQFVENDSMDIKIPVPKWEIVKEWGDYHFAISLSKNLRQLGIIVKITILPDWKSDQDIWYNNILLLRGLSTYAPKKYHFNMMWNISHPDAISLLEFELYDLIFVASLKWADSLKNMVDVPVIPLLQCTDKEKFDKRYQENKKYDLLFVGNSRKIFRKILKDLLPTQHNLSVFGSKWEGIIDEEYIKGEYISNEVLGDEYASCEILLNDHWDDMREKGFISNRIYDAFLASTFIISDKIEGAEEIFGDALVTYETKADLEQKITYYLSHEEERIKKIRCGKEIVLSNHTFEARAKAIKEYINQYKQNR